MTQEDKELLLKDLSARLTYGVYISPVDCGKAILIGIKDGNPLLWDTIQKKEYDKPWDIEFVKPYLRPMSSMTKEEKEEFEALWNDGFGKALDAQLNGQNDLIVKTLEITASYKSIQWLLKNHFDYRGLIEKGLALEAPEGMYNIKNK